MDEDLQFVIGLECEKKKMFSTNNFSLQKLDQILSGLEIINSLFHQLSKDV